LYGVTTLVQGADGNFYGTALNRGPSQFGAIFRLNRRRSSCANEIDLAWRPLDDETGFLDLIGAVKNETPALHGAWLVSAQGLERLWFGFTPAITPTAVFEFSLDRPVGGTVGLFSVVVTSRFKVCANWATTDTGGVGPTAEELKGLLERSPLPTEWLAAVRD
jgi:uncharacterized repeat protein (TIGR03803 family)